MIESVDKLRARIYDSTLSKQTREDMERIADEIEAEIEREIAYRYMELPVDADGVPVRIGDVMEFAYDPPQDQPIFEVSGFGAKGALFYVPRGEIRARKTTTASVVRHVKPRTLEDVLSDFAAEVENDRNTIETARKYAEEIRELMGSDE